MNTLKKDFTQEFSAQKAKLRPWAILALVAVCAVLVVLPVLFGSLNLSREFVTIYWVVCAILLLSVIPAFIRASKCPNCRKFMGKKVSKNCSLCGVKIQN